LSQQAAKPLDGDLSLVHEAACKRKALDPSALDLRPLTPFTDYFYICHSESNRQSKAIAEAVQEALDKAKKKSYHIEGLESGEWILIDAGEVVVHIFLSQGRREFYALEKLWADAERLDLPAEEAAS
jgi:ribosome-associated protein